MPIEKRPSNPIPKGPRPGSLTSHRVGDNETLESVARKYGVPVERLIAHNFGTTDPAEISAGICALTSAASCRRTTARIGAFRPRRTPG